MNDLISRRAAIKAIDDLPNCYNGYSDTYDKAYIIGTLEEVPSVEPKRGKWESNEYLYTTRQTRCSECKTEFYVDDLLNVGEGAQEYLPNYCPHCGARMYEVSDE